MKLIERIRTRVQQESFQPTLLSSVFRPDFIIRRGLFLAIRELAPALSGNVLDFGCGSKPYESLFTGASSYTGVDIEDSGHDHCDSKIDVFYDGENLPFEDGHFDTVVSFEVFEHIFNLPKILLEINRVTASFGYLFISLPFAWKEHEEPYDFARYTSFGIAHILKQAGYEIVEMRKTTTYILSVFQMLAAGITQTYPRTWTLRVLRQICIIFPCVVVAYVLNAVVPKRYEYFCNIVVLARKQASRPA
jgi:SAM-dependent methyltransferase